MADERVEQMSDRSLDALVAERVMGWKLVDSDPVPGEFSVQDDSTVDIPLSIEGEMYDGMYQVFAPTTNGLDMLWVLEAMRGRGWSACIANNACADTQNGCKFFRGFRGLGGSLFNAEPHEGVFATADTLPRAVCEAALQAVSDQKEVAHGSE